MDRWMWLAVVAVLCASARADRVWLDDGSHLVGKIEKVHADKLTIETAFAGTLEIDREHVKAFATDEPVAAQLVGGDRVVGTVSFDPGAGHTVHDEVSGDRAISVADVTSLWQPGGDSPEAAAAKARLEEARPKWAIRLEGGLTGEEGNTRRLNVNGRVKAKMTTNRHRLLLHAMGRYAQEEGIDTAQEIIGGAEWEMDLNRRPFWFASIEWENDRFEDLELRTTGTTGMGYFLIRDPGHELKLRAGGGFQRDRFRDGSTQCEMVAEGGIDYFKEIAEWLRVTHESTYYPSLEDVGDYRIVMENAAEIPLGKKKAWKIKLGVRNQYVARPQPDVKRLDTCYFLNLAWDIE